MKVYVVDDEINNLELFEDSLKAIKLKAETKFFSSPKQFLIAEKKDPCDIVFLDIKMPEINGLELANMIQTIKKDTNIIFLTAYSDYMAEAFDLFASGYLLKPIILSELKKQLNNLRYPIKNTACFEAKCFGNFDFLVNGEHVDFTLKKSKELLAYLIDRRGSMVSRKEMASILFENGSYNRNQQKNLYKIYQGLVSDLTRYHAQDILIKNRTGYCIDVNLITCDLFNYINSNKHNYSGEYMSQYSWAYPMF